ncbi:MAG: terpene cyclase/mutase family protein, partial [Lachnospiraceae bacterium]|nr:terpene cyclase/mutase family protein [Lachnospiraceae bacterium]
MIRFKKHFLPLIIVFICISSLVLKTIPTYADNSSEEDIYQSVQQNVLSRMDSKEEAIYGNEWLALDLTRDEQELSPYYLKDLIDTIIAKDGVLHTGWGDYTNYAKAVLVLTSLGIDASNVAGYNLIEPISAFPQVQMQGVNGVIYALLALDSANYEIQAPASIPFTVTRERYIKTILNSQLEDGGWDWADKQADPDMTAMAIQALAPYYDSDPDVKAAVDTALTTLSNLQQPDGGFQTEDAQFKE